MLIEQKTSYAYKLKYLENPTFDKVRGFAKSFIDDLPKELVDELYSQLERGVVQIDSEPQMLVYLYAFGNMHQAKLNKAFENIPELFFDLPDINIIDYGCGQAVGTMCYVDFIRQKGFSQKVKRVTLIEPSEICLKRAALHVSKFCPDAEIVTINKEFDELDDEDIVCEEDIPTLHILSNVLDLDFDLDRFAELISDNLKGYNQFVCVGPYFGFSDKDKRMENLYLLLNGEENYSQFFDRFELNAEREWTAQIRCFSKGELEEELSTEASKEDIENGEEDEYGVVYSKDGKRLLRSKYELKSYIVKNGTRVICDYAFSYCNSQMSQKKVKLQKKTGFKYSNNRPLASFAKENGFTKIDVVGYICRGEKNAGERRIYLAANDEPVAYCTKTIADYWYQHHKLPSDAVIGIADDGEATVLHMPSSNHLSTISYGSCLQQITIPDSVTTIGCYSFDGCKCLQQIIIPEGSEVKFSQMLPRELWDKLFYLKKAVIVEPQGGGDDLPF